MATPDKVILVAMNEVGYREKASNANLDSKTANAGANNWNKYAYYFDTKYPNFYNGKKNGFDWCDIFVDYCFVVSYGLDKALQMLCQPLQSLGAGCAFSAKYYQDKNRYYKAPAVGDQIFFLRNGQINHTGIVTKVDRSTGRVHTIEGNSDNGVAQRSYMMNDPTIAGYGRPDYTGPSGVPVDTVVMDVIYGKYGNGEARKKNLENAGFNYEAVQKAVNEFLKARR